MLAYYASRISPHMAKTSEGFLICTAVPIARTAVREPQRYRGSEIGVATDGEIDVFRFPEEVFSKAAMSSFEAATLTNDHPPTFLRPENWNAYARGHVQHVREGPRLENGERTLVADLIVKDGALIAAIENGKRDISCGYECSYRELDDGTFAQENIRGNHIAVCHEARAGEGIKIMDSKKRKPTRNEILKLIEDIMAPVRESQALREEGSRRSFVADARERDAAQARDFEEQARRYFRKRISVHHEPPPSEDSTPRRRAEDTAVSYEEAIRLVRRRMLEGK